jgi:hypothetical protein
MLNTIFFKIEAATPPRFAYHLPNRQIHNKLIEFLFCDTTNGKGVCTIEVIGPVYAATIEVKAVSTNATLCTTPVDAVATTAVERAIGAEAQASSRQGQ